MKNKRRLALLILLAALLLASALDGPVWLLTQPAKVDWDVRWAMARMHSWRGSTRSEAASDLRRRGATAVAAAPLLIDHLDDTGFTDLRQGLSTMFSFHGGPSIVRTKAGEALAAMGKAAVPALIDGMRNPRENVRMFVAELLGQAGAPEGIPVLQKALLTDPSPSVSGVTALALNRLQDQTLFGQVAARLHDPDPKRRIYAPGLLGALAGKDAIPLLREATGDSDPGVRMAAQEALRMAMERQ